MNISYPEKHNQQINAYLKHEQQQLLLKQAKIKEQKLNSIFDRNLYRQEKDLKMQEQILQSRFYNEQLKISQDKIKQLIELQKQKQDKKAIQQIEQQEQEIKQKVCEIQTKLKYEQFKNKTDNLISLLDYNLTRNNVSYYEKQEQNYLNDDYLSQKQLILNTSNQMNESYNKNLYSNYQMQMKRIQEICEQKLRDYEHKINRIYKLKYEKIDQIQLKVQQSQENLELIKQKSNQIFQNKINKIKLKIVDLQDKINLIEKKRLLNLQFTYNKEFEHNQLIFRNQSLNLLNKQIMKEQTFQLNQHQNQLQFEQRLSKLNQKQITQQLKINQTDQIKYLNRDQRLQDLIQNKLDVSRQRLKIIEDMEIQKRDMLLKLESDKINISQLKYFHCTPKEQCKLFITQLK